MQAILHTNGPLNVGIYGKWGTGKTTLLRMIQKRLEEHKLETVWFNPWQYEQDKNALLPLVKALLNKFEDLSGTYDQKIKEDAKNSEILIAKLKRIKKQSDDVKETCKPGSAFYPEIYETPPPCLSVTQSDTALVTAPAACVFGVQPPTITYTS
jgi:predicted KAP-like P-loop ATPase